MEIFYNLKDASKFLKISENALRKKCKRGYYVSARKIMREWVISQSEIKHNPRHTKTCIECNNVFYSNSGQKKICSTECKNKRMRKSGKKYYKNNYKRLIRNCLICNKAITHPKFKKTCNTKCSKELRKITEFKRLRQLALKNPIYNIKRAKKINYKKATSKHRKEYLNKQKNKFMKELLNTTNILISKM